MSHRQHVVLRVVALAVIAFLQFYSHDRGSPAPAAPQAEAVAISR